LLQILRLSCILRRGCGRVGGAAIYVRTLGTELEGGEPLPKKILETGNQAAKERDIYFEWELSFCLVGRIPHLFSSRSIFRPNGYR
jgi:hypothetical protein